MTISYLEAAYDNYDESIDYYKCRWDPSDSVYVKFEEDPLKKVPDYRDGYMSIVADTDRCSTDLKRPNLYEFSWQKQLEDFPIPGCLNYDSGASIYFRACDKGTIYYDIYYRHDCVGSIDVPNNVLGNGFCYAPGADDEGWTDVGAAESLYCLS